MEDLEKKDLKIENIGISELFNIIWNNRKKLSYFILTAIILSIIFSLNLSNIYRSSTVLLPLENNNNNLSSGMGEFSSFAGLVGFSLDQVGSKPSDEAIKRIQSYDFFLDYFLPNIQLENLTAVKNWDKKTNKIQYSSVFDAKRKIWKDSKKPTNQEAFETFKKILFIDEPSRSAFVEVSIDHKSPYIAKKWLDLLIFNINESMRENDKKISKKSIDFLNEAFSSAGYVEIKKVISSLTENQMKKYMLASANEDYIFKIIESPIVSEKKFLPNRGLIVIFGTLFGFLVGISYILVTTFRKKQDI